MNLWLDDKRPPPDKTWFWVKSVDNAIKAINMLRFKEMSLDHDLGDGTDGITFVDYMAEHSIWPSFKPVVHSMNPVGRKRMEMTIDRYFPEALE